jgi:hypothetical protein
LGERWKATEVTRIRVEDQWLDGTGDKEDINQEVTQSRTKYHESLHQKDRKQQTVNDDIPNTLGGRIE